MVVGAVPTLGVLLTADLAEESKGFRAPLPHMPLLARIVTGQKGHMMSKAASCLPPGLLPYSILRSRGPY